MTTQLLDLFPVRTTTKICTKIVIKIRLKVILIASDKNTCNSYTHSI